MFICSENYDTSAEKNRKVSIKNIKLVKDGGGYAIDVTYTIETPERIEELHIPRAKLFINPEKVSILAERDFLYGDTGHVANLGFGNTPLRQVNGVAYTIKTIKEKTKEMTLEEIEKKLGHKVKIVSEKGERK